MKKGYIVLILILLVILIGYFIWSSNDEDVNININVNTANENLTEDLETTDGTIVYQFAGLLESVIGDSSYGEVKANFENGAYTLLATFGNLPDLEGTDFYEGWIVRNDPQSVISTGVAVKEDGIYKNMYGLDQDLTDHDFYVLTLEPDDGDPAPAKHILEGLLN
ncbi:anti-sigma factor [Patescibacteria group bacterium]|nr:anti-sigma factor [Patescibacteria group bacterium]